MCLCVCVFLIITWELSIAVELAKFTQDCLVVFQKEMLRRSMLGENLTQRRNQPVEVKTPKCWVYNEQFHQNMHDDWGYPHLWTPIRMSVGNKEFVVVTGTCP